METSAIKLNFDVLEAKEKDPECKPLVVLHGLLGTRTNWQPICREPAISKGRDVFLVDLRNHGKSPHTPTMTLELMVKDLIRFLEAAKFKQAPTILGHSMGGKVAMGTALARPDLVGALIPVDIPPVSYPSGDAAILENSRMLQKLMDIPLIQIESRQKAMDEMEFLFPQMSNAQRQFILTNYVPVRGVDNNATFRSGTWKWRCNLAALRQYYDSNLTKFPHDWKDPDRPKFDGPTLFLRGDDSQHHRLEHNEACTAFFPQAEVITIFDAGHWVHVDQPLVVRDTLAGYLRQFDGSFRYNC